MPFKTAVERHRPYVLVLRRPFKKAFTTLSLHVPLQNAFKKGFQTTLSYPYMFPLRRPVKKAVKLHSPDIFSLRRLFKKAFKHPSPTLRGRCEAEKSQKQVGIRQLEF